MGGPLKNLPSVIKNFRQTFDFRVQKMAFVTKMSLRSLSTSVTKQSSTGKVLLVKEFVVIGGGLMGAGIAQVGAQTGHKVTLVDISQNVLDKSQSRINESIKRVAKKKFKDAEAEKDQFISAALQRLNIATNPDEALSTADLVVEAVTENLPLKQKLFSSYDKFTPAKTIFASNTSSLPIKDIAQSTPDRLDRFGGLHFFQPGSCDEAARGHTY